MILNMITGYSASMRSEKVTLPAFVDNVLADMPSPPEDIHKHVAMGNDDEAIQESIEYMTLRPYEPVMLIGKSMGAVRTWWMVYKHWRLLSERDQPISVFLIDPHGWQKGDGRIGSYGSRRPLKWNEEWNLMNIRFNVYYQRNKYPRGARMNGTYPNLKNEELCGKANHWNVTQIDTRPGRKVADGIQGAIRSLM